jgi:hypothetical protein
MTMAPPAAMERKGTPLEELNKPEHAHQEVAARGLQRGYTRKFRRLHGWMDESGLLDLQRRLQHRDREQFNADGVRVVNGKLREAISELKGYIGFIGRASSFVAAGGREPRTVRGLG